MNKTNLIIQIVNEEIGVNCQAKNRTPKIIDARFLAMFFLWKYGMSKSEIGRYFKKNHATVINAIKKVEDYQIDKNFKLHFLRINQRIKNQVIEKKEDVVLEMLGYCPGELIKRYHDAL